MTTEIIKSEVREKSIDKGAEKIDTDGDKDTVKENIIYIGIN